MAIALTEERVTRLEGEVSKIRTDLAGVQVSLANQDKHREELKGLVQAGFAELKALIRDRALDEQRRAERFSDEIKDRMDKTDQRVDARFQRVEGDVDRLKLNQASVLARISLPAGVGAAVTALAIAAQHFWRSS